MADVIIDIDKKGKFVILYKYAEDCQSPDSTPSQYCGHP